MNIVLIGFMGAGKTTVGKRLAKRLGYHFIDTDTQIQYEQGCGIPDIFAAIGEQGFRYLETELLKRLISIRNTIIATGGGIITTEGNFEILKKIGSVIYLDTNLDVIYNRVKGNDRRPLLKTENPKQTLIDLFAKREHLYQQATHIINSSSISLNEIASQIIRII
jgi:shikimate kinase